MTDKVDEHLPSQRIALKLVETDGEWCEGCYFLKDDDCVLTDPHVFDCVIDGFSFGYIWVLDENN